MTLLEVVNKVLIKLRHAEVASTTESEFAKLVTQFVNESRREIEDAWNWMALRTTVTVTTVSGASQYILSGVGNSRFKILSVINDTDDNMLKPLGANEMTKRFLYGETSEGAPINFAFNGFDASGDPIVDLYPIPSGAFLVRFNLVVPQNETTVGSTEIKVPSHIVYLGAYVKALAERGEDQSSGYEVAVAAYTGALATHIAQESALLPDEDTWHAV